ncbi:chloride channel protein [Candidatus Sumerlaeota bacterium]|nr:chloride channel protein [Candidatus Sumerlaeota bacterium]
MQVHSMFQCVRRWHDHWRQSENFYLMLLALIVGLLGGCSVVVFFHLIHFVQTIVWNLAEEYNLEHFKELPWYWIIGVPTLGGLTVGLFIKYVAGESKGHGVPEVMESVALHGGRLNPSVILTRMIASGLCIATGGSVGKEGPVVHIGATLGSAVGQWLRIDERRLRTLVGCGAAAGIAGTFNAPIAGAIFAAEVVLGDFAVTSFSPIVIASVCSTVVARFFLGDAPAFTMPGLGLTDVRLFHYQLQNPMELFAYAVLGVAAAFAAIAFIKTLYWSEDFFEKIKIWPPLLTMLGGLAIGLIGLKLPHIFGSGEEAILLALKNEMTWGILALLVLIKMISVSVTLGTGGSGGVFSPSLFIGAMLGGFIGCIVHGIWPESTAAPGAYALVGMGAVLGCSMHAPLTGILMIFEMTNDYKIILPLMVSVITANVLAMKLFDPSIYTLKLLRRGIDLHAGRDVNLLRHIPVREIMREEVATCGLRDSLTVILSHFVARTVSSVFVIDGERRFLGRISIDDIRPLLDEVESFKQLMIAQELMITEDIPQIAPHENLDTAMRLMERNQRTEIPVVEDGKLIGAVWPDDVIQTYNEELIKSDMAHNMAVAVSKGAPAMQVPGVEGLSMMELKVPSRFFNQTLDEADIRRKYGPTVLVVKRMVDGREKMQPLSPKFVLHEGDSMLLMGAEEDLRRLASMG